MKYDNNDNLPAYSRNYNANFNEIFFWVLVMCFLPLKFEGLISQTQSAAKPAYTRTCTISTTLQ